MKKILIINLFLFLFSPFSFGQALKYTYPLSISKYSEDVTSMELYSEVVSDFDTLNINGVYEIESDPSAKRYLKKGKLIKIQNYIDNFKILYHYDRNGNIRSRVANRSDGTTSTITYNLDQKNSKLETIIDNFKKQEITFDSLNREVVKRLHSRSSRGGKERKFVTIYQGDNILRKEKYIDEVLQNIEKYTYFNDQLRSTRTVDAEGNLIEVKKINYYEGRKETDRISFSNLNTYRILRVDFFDKKENLTKSYNVTFTKEKSTALITEFRLSF